MGPLISQQRADRLKLLASVHSERTIQELTGVGRNTLWRMKRRGFRALPKGFKQRPRPSDFAIQCRHMTVLEMAAHYRTSNRIIARWKRELGLSGRVVR